ncbi:MAG: DUF4136 domain-containing protein [Flavobacterium sp.]|uniref:DUF4136 domain-containing protein n=1 Tax=Flavobacterium sp. TaxID=239 RepID=UPI00261C1DEF|nr:DUF4136 domain-containing protein [Flavobacterium sp.]MDD5150506.1 DUF4136 domain-containing protein [Flavobacterium sp.]
MKTIKLLPILLLFVLSSCSSVSVYSDFDKGVDFSQYKTYAFHRKGIDKVQISEMDKKRILTAIDLELSKKGMTKSENPDLLINIFTKEREQVDVSQFNVGWGYGWGWGWNPYLWGGRNYVNTSTEGTLYIDLIDANKKELVWEGEGVGYLTQNRSKKEERINEFVAKILAQYPPTKK